MEEILASIRRIIADDDASKPAKAPETAAPPKPPAAAAPSRPMPPATPAKSATSPPPTARPAAPVVANSQDAIDAMLAELDGPPNAAPQPAATQPGAPAADVLDLTEAMAEPVRRRDLHRPSAPLTGHPTSCSPPNPSRHPIAR